MAGQQGRDFLLKIEVGDTPGVFQAIGAARMVAMDIVNDMVPATPLGGGTAAADYTADAGVQDMRLELRGLFKDSMAEEYLRTAAFGAVATAAQLCFPNGDVYQALFAVESYRREGRYDDMEAFSATLLRCGTGTWMTAPSVPDEEEGEGEGEGEGEETP